jgi:hypothetical protein
VVEEEQVSVVVQRLLALALVVAIGVAAACGGDGRDPRRFEGLAGRAVAQFWLQEASAGRLPEGVAVEGRGTRGIVTLETAGEDEKARVCVELFYIVAAPPFETHTRVYVATLREDDLWYVEPVNPDGTCEGVV